MKGPSAQQLLAVLDSIPARVALIDRERRHRYVNAEYCSFVGRPMGEVVGRTVAELIGEQAYRQVRRHGERALAGEVSRWAGWLGYGEGKNPRYVQRVYMPYRDDTGAIDGYFIFARDLTDLKRSEEELAGHLAALRESEALNAAITASALDCIIAVDEQGRVVEFNPAAERTFRYTRAEAVGAPIADLIVPPHLRKRHGSGFRRYLVTGEAHVLGRRVEMEAMRKDGSIFPVELTINEVRLSRRRLFTAYLRNLSAAKEAEGEIERQRAALHQGEKLAALGSLLAGVAHELNNPLSIVIGNSLMLEEDAAQSGRELADRAAKVRMAAERCGRIVRTFLAMARQSTPEPRETPMQPVIDGALDLLGYSMRTSGVAVTCAVDAVLPPVIGDPDQLHQVLVNLLVNARQALEPQPAPRIVTISGGADARFVWVRVADNGPGIPDAIRGRVFDPFFTNKPAGSGTGIGLAVSRGIVEAHGGTLTLVEGEGGGAAFMMRLPGAMTAAPYATSGLPDGADTSLANCIVLIVDDEPDFAGLVAEMLRGAGARCVIAGSGVEAKRALRRRRVDALLCDLKMPDLDGPGLFAWLDAHRPALRARTAFMTGDTLGSASAEFLRESGRPLLEKPFTAHEARRVVASLVGAPPR